ncbi:hypothetical protein [Nitrosovibrio sp. Nv17]|uniref:hypothetical protein n=1 Tax=Nitrosovibrio sp. Nv17 TaxID=1855339 RepID=UPI000908B373|nr:hypothetical protein [Nitrosovibrio sp. Nv17]SFW14215.1 hypothetical protein SAMN05216414_102133 [Nitrosovibrio sp. Nv17]
MDGNDEWYWQGGYTELIYALLVVGVVTLLYLIRRSFGTSTLAARALEDSLPLLGLIALAVVLFVINRVLGGLW